MKHTGQEFRVHSWLGPQYEKFGGADSIRFGIDRFVEIRPQSSVEDVSATKRGLGTLYLHGAARGGEKQSSGRNVFQTDGYSVGHVFGSHLYGDQVTQLCELNALGFRSAHSSAPSAASALRRSTSIAFSAMRSASNRRIRSSRSPASLAEAPMTHRLGLRL